MRKINKYGAVKCEADGYKFASFAERMHYLLLKDRLKHGEISNLELQPIYHISIKDIKICKVILDFKYFDNKINKERVIDVKGMDNPLSKLKRKLVEAEYNIKVELVTKR